MKTITVKYRSNIPEKFTGKVILESGDIGYLKDGKYHREDGPCVICTNGYKEYFLNGKFHRIGGPAVEWTIGYEEYWIHGEKVSKEAHDLLADMLKLKENKI